MLIYNHGNVEFLIFSQLAGAFEQGQLPSSGPLTQPVFRFRNLF